MRPTLIVDASVAVKWLVPEIYSLHAVGLRDRYEFAAPDILVAEVTNILWKKTRRREITADDAEDAIFAFGRAAIRYESTEAIAAQVLRLSRELDHPAYDCFYLYTAAISETFMVTADERLIRKLASCGMPEWAELALDLRML